MFGPEGKCEQLQGAEALQGAYPYVAPEVHQGRLSIAVDIYAYGVVLLEILTGLPAAKPTPQDGSLVSMAEGYWGVASKLEAILDPSIEWEERVVEALTDLAERCLGPPNRRPRAKAKLGELEDLLGRPWWTGS